jgi:hypothetical protein
MTTTYPTNSTFCGNTSNGFGGIPAPSGNVPFNGFAPASYAGTTTGYPYPGFTNGTFANPGYTPSFNAPGFAPIAYAPSNFQWPQQWSQFTNAPTFGGWNNSGFRANGYPGFSGFNGFGGFSPAPFTNGFASPGFNSVPTFNTWPSFNSWPTSNNWTSPGFAQSTFPQNFGGFTPGFVSPFASYESGFGGTGFGGFPAWNWQQNFNTPFTFAQGYNAPSFGAFPWTPGFNAPFTGPFNGPFPGPTNYGGQFNYGPFNVPFTGTYGQPFNGQYPTGQYPTGQYTNGQFVNGYMPTGGSIPGTCNGIGLNREAA